MNDLIWIISSCVLILAVIAVRAIFGKRMSAGLRYALWGLVLIRLLVPGTLFSSPVSVKSAVQSAEVVQNFEAVKDVSAIAQTDNGAVIGQMKRPEGVVQANNAEHTAVETGESTPAEQHAMQPASQTSVILSEATPERFERMRKTLEVRDVFNIIWYTGMALAALYFIAANLRFYLKLRARRQRLDVDAGCPVYSVEGLNSSCLFLNSIYISNENAGDAQKLACVLEHEKAHRRHGDGLFALLRTAALVLHWYNPLVWAAAFMSRRDSELFADAGAIKALGENTREDYGRTLIELSARPSIYAPIACAATMMTGGKRELKSRIRNIAKRKRMGVIVCAVVLILAAAAVGCTFLGGTVSTEDSPLLNAAWEEAQRIAVVHGLDIKKQEHRIFDSDNDYETQIEFFSPDQKSPDAVIDLVLYGSDADGWEVTQRLLMLKPDESVDEAKLASDLEAIRPDMFPVTAEELKSAGLTAEDASGAAEYAARWFCDTLTDRAFEGNLFRCSAAEPVSMSQILGEETYSLTVAVRPENERAFANGMSLCMGPLLDGSLSYDDHDPEAKHPDFDRCFTVTFEVNVTRTSDGAFEVKFVYPSLPYGETQTEATPVPEDASLACIDIARNIAEAVCLEHGVTMDTENGELKQRRDGSYEVTYSSGSSAVIRVVFDEDITAPAVTDCTLERYDAPEVNEEKFMSELGYLNVTTRGRTYKIADIEDNLGAPMTADGIAEKLGAYDIASIFCLLGGDNYFVCSDAATVRLEKVSGDDDCGRYNVTVAMRPVNDALFAAGFGDILGPLWNAVPSEYDAEHNGFDYCYTIGYVMQVKKIDDGSAFKIDYGYTWESFEEQPDDMTYDIENMEQMADIAWAVAEDVLAKYGGELSRDNCYVEGSAGKYWVSFCRADAEELSLPSVSVRLEFLDEVDGWRITKVYYNMGIPEDYDWGNYQKDDDDLPGALYFNVAAGSVSDAAWEAAKHAAEYFMNLPESNTFSCTDAAPLIIAVGENYTEEQPQYTVSIGFTPRNYIPFSYRWADGYSSGLYVIEDEHYLYYMVDLTVWVIGMNADGTYRMGVELPDDGPWG